MNKYISFIIVIVLIVLGIWFFTQDKESNTKIPDPGRDDTNLETKTEPITNLDNKIMTKATLHTNKGDIAIEFFREQAPNTVANFTKLAGEHFYDGVKFHRVIKGFMIQGGDPLSRDNANMSLWGTGDPGYKFADEIDPQSVLYSSEQGYKKGIVAMANSGPNTNGSQFFIMTENYPLPPLYTIFGKVISGQEVVDKIADVETGPNDRPIEPIVINTVSLD